MQLPELSLICPAYNDEKNIGPLVEKSISVLAPLCSRLEIILVEDGSPDGTASAIDELAAKLENVKTIHHPVNRGHGAALKSGIRIATCDLVALMDGDGQYEPADIAEMLKLFPDVDLVQGSRASYPNGPVRHMLSLVYNLILRTTFHVSFTDLGCSIKLFKRDIVSELPAPDGIFMQGELVLRAHFAGRNVVQQTVDCGPREHGASSSLKMKNVKQMASDFLNLRAELKKKVEKQKA